MAEPYVMTDANGDKWTFDPACKSCGGTGRVCVGSSGREDDGDAPLFEDCDCFIPYGVASSHEHPPENQR